MDKTLNHKSNDESNIRKGGYKDNFPLDNPHPPAPNFINKCIYIIIEYVL